MPVVDIQSETQTPITSVAPRRSIDLDIAGTDFMLRGRFSDWESGLVFGPDLDRVRVRLAIDSTSARRPDTEPSLFSFHSRDVESLERGGYRAVGTLAGAKGKKKTEVSVETPAGHTALVVVSFSAKKQDFGDGWHDLLANVVPLSAEGGGQGPSRLAHAWLVAPSLASA
jgi:hypothetical protein